MISLVAVQSVVAADEVDISKLPPPADRPVSYEEDIRPIFENSCFRCHGPEKPKSRFRLDNRESALAGGSLNDDDIVPGDSAKSRLIHYVGHLVEDMEMPPPGKADPLTPEQIGLLRAWIDQGAHWPDSAAQPPSRDLFSVTPAIRWFSVSGDEQRFREHFGVREGWSAGLDHFFIHEENEERSYTLEGHVYPDEEDYTVSLLLEERDVGFARMGVSHYRQYFDDSGGFYEPFATAPMRLDRDLHLDIGKAWVDVGLNLPEWPRIVVGYEYHFKEGERSILEWGSVTRAPAIKKISPAAKAIDERVHVIKFDADHTIYGWTVADQFRYEFYDLDTSRESRNFTLGAPAPSTIERTREGYRHEMGANSVRLERWFREWLFAGLGYLYTWRDGDASVSFNRVTGATPPLTLASDFSNEIMLKQRSHVANFSTMVGPWEGLIFSGGIQSDWTRQESFGNAQLNPAPATVPALLKSDIDRATLEERAGLRFTGLPFTVLYAEGRFQQESLGQFEQETTTGPQAFLRDTDATSELAEYRAGFNMSPWTWISLQVNVRHRDKDSHYDHDLDSSPGSYSAFIRQRSIETDEIETKLVVRVTSWLRTTWKYQIVATDFHTETDPSSAPSVTPGGEIFAGNYDAHIYSVNLLLTPMSRLYLNSTFSFQQSRTDTGQMQPASIDSYRGDSWSVLSSAHYALNPETALFGSYAYSRADFGQDNEAAGLPLGVVHDRHAIQFGVSRKLRKNITTKVQYGYYRYKEPTSGGFNDYTAHAVFATMTMRWP